MRMRRKPWARPELAACPYYIPDPPALRGRWHNVFALRQPIYLDLGCGKGGFLVREALAHPEINYLGIDIKSEVLAVARREAERLYREAGRPVCNLLLCSFDIARLGLVLCGGDTVSRIYINFPNPWPKEGHKKRRLTHPRQLAVYREFLDGNGQLCFKSDDEPLFRDTLGYLPGSGFEAELVSEDFRRDFPFAPGAMTEHEAMFAARRLPVFYIQARKTAVIQSNR